MRISFSKYDLTIKTEGDDQLIFDIIRKKYVSLTPEEWVRQHILHYLIDDYAFPKALISVEKQLFVHTLQKRTDIVLYNRSGLPTLIIECKAPEVKISQKTFEQIASYNLSLQVPFLWVTNGDVNYLCRIDHEAKAFSFLDVLPPKEELYL